MRRRAFSRALTLQAGTGYGDTPEAALTDAIAYAKLNADDRARPVAQPFSNPTGSNWTPGAIRGCAGAFR